jgi:hypothetical protein
MSIATKKNSSSFRDGWVGFMRTLASSHNVQFVFGRSPKTDGKVIMLPSLPLDLTGDDASIVRGDAFHEIGHVNFTDNVLFNDFYVEEGGFASSLLNAIEDPWMEQRAIALCRTAEHFLRLSSDIFYKRHRDKFLKLNVRDSYVGFVSFYYFSELIGWSEYDQPLSDATNTFLGLFGEGADIVLSSTREILCEDALSCTSTQDNVKLTKRILDMLHNLSPDIDQSDNVDEESESDGVNNKPDDDEAEAVNAATDKLPGTSQSGKVEEPKSETETPIESSFVDKIETMLSEHAFEGSEAIDLRTAVEDISVDSQYSESAFIPIGTFIGSGASKGENLSCLQTVPENVEYYNYLIQGLERKTNVLLMKLQQLLLQARTESETIIGHRGSRIAASKLHRLSQNNLAIFTTAEEESITTPTVSILCDLSGSTQDDSTDVAIYQSAYLFSAALNCINIANEILGFGDKEERVLSVVKSFNEGFEQSKYRLGGFKEIAGGGTPMLEATFQASMRSLSFGGERNVIFILTDGSPFDQPQTAMHAQELELSGVELVYVLIGSQAPSDWLKEAGLKFIKISKLHELQQAILDQLKSLLI